MYYPYFRGKQFELLALRESADLIADSRFVPIIEPVRESFKSLERALDALRDAGAQAIVLVNPKHGDHKDGGQNIASFLRERYHGIDSIQSGLLLRADSSPEQLLRNLREQDHYRNNLVHAGFADARAVVAACQQDFGQSTQIFIEDQANSLYRRHFVGSNRVLIRDGFRQQKNADYDPVEVFSDLHVTYGDFSMAGYGDFLTVGDRYSEGGGPAYAVAIHLTFIDPSRDNGMFIYHFISDSNDTPTDPAGKFAQALAKLMDRLDTGSSHLHETSAITELRRLSAFGHFPGLGYLKKLSIKHHLETLANFHASVAR